MTNPTGEEILHYLLEAGEAQYPVKVKWGKGSRNVVIFQGKKYQYKGTGEVNKILLKSILPLYISMSSNTLNKNTKNNEKNNKDKITKQSENTYRITIKEQLEKLKTKSIQNVKVDLTKINIKELATDLGQVSNDIKIYMKLLTTNRYYALNDRTINLLLKGNIDMSAAVGSEEQAISVSDGEVVALIDKEKEVEIFVVEKNKTRQGGAFFPYINNTIFDFDKYGIFKNVDRNNYKHNCLYLALEAGGLSDIKLQQLILTLRNRTIHKCDLEHICDILQINIELISLRTDGQNRVEHYGRDYEEKYYLGLIKNHYFINDTTNVTSYCLENYNEVKGLQYCNTIYNDKHHKKNDRFINAFKLFKILINNIGTLISPMTLTEEIMRTQFYDKVDEYKTLEYSKQSYRQDEYKEKIKDVYKIFFDFETITSEEKHIPYLCWIYNEEIQQEFIGINNCAVKMLNALPTDKNEILLIAHNADYDCRFILQYLQNPKPIVKNGRFLQIKATYYNPIAKKKIKVIIKDSLKLIPMALAKFGKCFNLNCHKEVMPYNVYTYENVSMGAVSIQSALDVLNDEDKQQFLDNIEKWDCVLGNGMNNKMFDLIKYSSIYCKMDCQVLMKGYEVFREWMLECTELDVDYYITIQSLAATYMLKSGCYNNVYQLSGVLQQYISRCVVGGRVMSANNKMYHVEKKIADFDACSLYPSAMYFMDGFLEGLPKILQNKSYAFLKEQDGYFIRVKIIRLNKHLDFPLTSKIDENGVRDFTNDMTNEIIYIDKVGLEDLITFHDAEFEIIDGYYFNEGRNDTINIVIKNLYDKRLKLKKEKNPAEKIIKLFINSMYGKTIIKPVETDTIIKDNREDFEKYISYNYNYIDSVLEVNGRYYIKKVKSVMSHFNYVHCGVEILSMSKRIMNKVFSCADDVGIKIYYQDTDSIHLNYDDVPKIVARYKQKYNQELVGEYLGNFHVDFDMDGACGEIYAKESLFLGKKTYIDILESTDKDGNTINSEHIRMKGIPTPCIKYYAKQNNMSVLDLYKKLYKGEIIEFDLTNDDNKFVCRNNKDHTISNLHKGDCGSTRKTKFIKKDNEKIYIN